jgi:hypothetical protein
MATTIRSKYKQMEQMAKEAEVVKENLAQDAIEEKSENDSDYNAETSHLTIQKSEINSNYEADDSHELLQDITTLSTDISNIILDDIEAEFLEVSKQSKWKRKPQIKTRRPKTSWV